MNETNVSKKFMRADEVAKYFSISRSHFYKMVNEMAGFPAPLKISERVALFDVNAIEEFFRKAINENTTTRP